MSLIEHWCKKCNCTVLNMSQGEPYNCPRCKCAMAKLFPEDLDIELDASEVYEDDLS